MCEIELPNTLAQSIEIRRPGILTICEIRVVEGGKDRKIVISGHYLQKIIYIDEVITT